MNSDEKKESRKKYNSKNIEKIKESRKKYYGKYFKVPADEKKHFENLCYKRIIRKLKGVVLK